MYVIRFAWGRYLSRYALELSSERRVSYGPRPLTGSPYRRSQYCSGRLREESAIE